MGGRVVNQIRYVYLEHCWTGHMLRVHVGGWYELDMSRQRVGRVDSI